MSLSYHVRFAAPGKTPARDLQAFLRDIEQEAQRLGFSPTMVLDAKFDTVERREFRKRLTYGATIRNEALKGVVLAAPDQFWRHDSEAGEVRVLPNRAVVLVVTGEQAKEAVLGFFKYPTLLKDLNGNVICSTGLGQAWCQDFDAGSDTRLRKLVDLFRNAGYVASEKDKLKPASAA